MKRAAIVVVACSFLCLFSGCFRTVFHGDHLQYGVAMQRPDPATEAIVDRFEESRWNHYFLFGLVPTSEADMDDILRRHVRAGQEVRNLKIEHKATFVNGLLWVLVGGLYNPMTTIVSGDVVQVRTVGTAM